MQTERKAVTPRVILAVLNIIDWSGHIEIGDHDKWWLSQQLADALNPPKDKLRCESCGHLEPIVIKTPVGSICETCISLFAEQADEIREELEG